ncbi:cytochrome b561 and DOMON domain-containing protein At5g47530-like [Ipomoea triloba]|uniref:cytochrome b561 and DOMON domain-containing protein At5g47530-like n=1 Tax=Ipomoea triloba TaxID=35885 RepID=UPI00125CEC01|nr:cytochrome b561 and DOMON domain-containing protein At5g47530-like [Ipomoea triloba]
MASTLTLHYTNLQFVTVLLSSLFLLSSSQSCSNYTFNSNRTFSSCADLPYLDAHLHWNYMPSVRIAAVAYRARQAAQGWVAWGINPNATGMVGSQAIIAFRASNGSMMAYTVPITSYDPAMAPATVSFRVSGLAAEYVNEEMIIFATIGPLRNGSVVNQVWQAGDSVYDNIPQPHSIAPSNLESMGEIDFLMYLS